MYAKTVFKEGSALIEKGVSTVAKKSAKFKCSKHPTNARFLSCKLSGLNTEN